MAKAKPAQRNTIGKWPIIGAVLIVLYTLGSWLDSNVHKFYAMTPEALNAAVQTSLSASRAAGQEKNATHVVETLLGNLVQTYPELDLQTDFRNPREWVFNNAGGAMGSMYIIHASITEYLIIFGSAVGTEGHTGRHTADDYFHILTGQQRCYAAGDLEPLIYNPGDVNLMKRGIVRQYWMEGETWALEYAAGWIPPMLPFGLADMLSSTLDYISFYHTCRITAREMIKNLLRGKI
jgi:C-8 sterol isomerase